MFLFRSCTHLMIRIRIVRLTYTKLIEQSLCLSSSSCSFNSVYLALSVSPSFILNMQCPREEGVLWPLTKLEEINTFFFKIHIQSKYFLSPWLTGSLAYHYLWRSVQWGVNISREGQKLPPTSDSKTIFTWQYICIYSVCTCIPRNMDLCQIFFSDLEVYLSMSFA